MSEELRAEMLIALCKEAREVAVEMLIEQALAEACDQRERIALYQSIRRIRSVEAEVCLDVVKHAGSLGPYTAYVLALRDVDLVPSLRSALHEQFQRILASEFFGILAGDPAQPEPAGSLSRGSLLPRSPEESSIRHDEVNPRTSASRVPGFAHTRVGDVIVLADRRRMKQAPDDQLVTAESTSTQRDAAQNNKLGESARDEAPPHWPPLHSSFEWRRSDSEQMRVKLCWRSKLTGWHIFVNSAGSKVLELPATRVAEMVRSGKLMPVEPTI